MKMENVDLSWELGSSIPDAVFQDILYNNQQPERNSRTLKEMMSSRDLTLLDIYERERQLAAREAAALRLEERGRQQEISAREAVLVGRETALAMKERELSLSERERAVQESEINLKEQQEKLNIAKHKLTELENEFYRKSQQESILTSTRDRELHAKEDKLQKKEHELGLMKSHLDEKHNEIEKLKISLKELEEFLTIKQKDLEVRENDMEIRGNDVAETMKQLKEQREQNERDNKATRKEFETIKCSLEEKALQLKNTESCIILQERELDEKRLEIQRELEKHDEILRDTANTIAEKEEEFKKLERETMAGIEAQEKELKLWETELQQQENKIQQHKQDLEKHKADILEREEAIVMQSQQMLQWQKQLQTRAFSLNEQAEAQEEHLRVILEKEKIFDDLKATLEQKEQQYKMLVQCKEHEFDVREQNLQKIISDVLNSENKKMNAWYSDITTLSKKVSSLMYESYGHNVQPTTKFVENVSHHSPSQIAARDNQVKGKLKSSHRTSENSDVKSQIGRDGINTSHNIQQEGIFPESVIKMTQQSPNEGYLKLSQITTRTRKNLAVPSQDSTHEKCYVREAIPITHSAVPDTSLRHDLTLSEEQIQLLEKIKNNTLRKEENFTVPQFPKTICNIQNEKPKNTNIVENFKKSHLQHEKGKNIIQFKECFPNQKVQEKICNISRLKHNILGVILPEKHSPKALSSNDIILCPQIQTRSRSTSCDDLRDALDTDLNEQNTLQGATKSYRFEIVRSLVERHGVNVDGQDSDGRTALHWAAELGHLALVQYLGGEMGASVDAQTNTGHTALHLSALEGRLDVVQYLIETLGADTEARDLNGETALHLAAGAGWLEVVKYISGVKALHANRTPIKTNVPRIQVDTFD